MLLCSTQSQPSPGTLCLPKETGTGQGGTRWGLSCTDHTGTSSSQTFLIGVPKPQPGTGELCGTSHGQYTISHTRETPFLTDEGSSQIPFIGIYSEPHKPLPGVTSVLCWDPASEPRAAARIECAGSVLGWESPRDVPTAAASRHIPVSGSANAPACVQQPECELGALLPAREHLSSVLRPC